MNALNFGRPVVGVLVSIGLLGGCGGQISQSPSAGALSQPVSRTHAVSQDKNGPLVYAAGDGHTYVLTYPGGKLVGSIAYGAFDACSDAQGDVFLTVDAGVLEFAHGATEPTQTLSVPGSSIGCAIDPTTGNLAVTFSLASGADVAVFNGAQGQPTLYYVTPNPFYCGYDKYGNLFVDYNVNGSSIGLSELPNGGSAFSPVSLSPTLLSTPGRIQWDGSYITLETGVAEHHPSHSLRINRLAVSGSSATIISATTFKDIRRVSQLSWIYGDRVIVPYGNAGIGSPDINYWNYPKGGNAARLLKHPAGKRATINAVTISASQ
jgi:hypothetical protein